MKNNNKIENWVVNNTNKNWGKWVYEDKDSNERVPWPSPPTDEEMIEDVLSRVEDKGFFTDMMAWLRSDAPRKLRTTVQELHAPLHIGPVAYDRLCEVVYQLGFRASEVLERRMILGPTNKWVKKYFGDFPGNRPPATR